MSALAKLTGALFGSASTDDESGPIAAALVELDRHVAKLRRIVAEREPLTAPFQRLSEMQLALSNRRAELRREGMNPDAVAEATKAEQAAVDAFEAKHRKTIERANALGQELALEASMLDGLRWDVLHAQIIGPEADAYVEARNVFQQAHQRFVAHCQAADSLNLAGRTPMMPGLSTWVTFHGPVNEASLAHLRQQLDLTGQIAGLAAQITQALSDRSNFHGQQEKAP